MRSAAYPVLFCLKRSDGNGETTTVDVTLDEENTDRNAAMDELQQEYSASQQQQSQQQQQQGGYFQWPFGW